MSSIRKATGWFKGRDGKWRFEIDDSKAEFRRDGDARLMQEEGYQRMQELTDKWIASINDGTEFTEAEQAEMEQLGEKYYDAVWEEKHMLTDFLKHDELFEAYPRLKGVALEFDELPAGANGFFSKRSNTIVLSDKLFGKSADTLIHEIQHIIQNYEGFAKGSNPHDINPIKKVGQSVKSDTSLLMTGQPENSGTSSVGDSIRSSSENVNKQFSVSERTPEQKKEILAQARRYASGEIGKDEFFRHVDSIDGPRRGAPSRNTYRQPPKNQSYSDEAREIYDRAHSEGVSVDEYLRRNWVLSEANFWS